MSVITISRGSFSKGKQVAEAVAHELNYECISREILLEASDQFNIPEIKLTRALHDAPSIIDRFSNGRERYLRFFKSTFFSHMEKGNIVYHGLAGHFFLENISHVLKVRIMANMSHRVLEEMKRENCKKEEALYRLKEDDRERRKWSMHLHGKDSWDSSLYDIVLCIDTLSIDDVTEILVNTVQKKQFHETAESRHLMRQKVLRANIEAQLSEYAPYGEVTLRSDSSIELTNIRGQLQYDKNARHDFNSQMKEKFNIEKVHYGELVDLHKNRINPFHNISAH